MRARLECLKGYSPTSAHSRPEVASVSQCVRDQEHQYAASCKVRWSYSEVCVMF
jgi:hypothetical protein